MPELLQPPAAFDANAYWRHTRRFTAALLLVWFGLTFGVIYFAQPLSEMTFFGWPLSYYMTSQGLMIAYVLIVAVYMTGMRRLDRKLGQRQGKTHDT
ncbi:putative solute:sodium symporter small subunit [Noviherbaspirillum humi]|uniref:Putative solute:sodium symporter small subunit n=1 Tax=Noviherbaspirillum humi TaxID=1688639 RepID=A0A239E3W7_9BURK|nr:DUF4212 domain-containing protein [Noviherbaspirillum humi]SNS39091.1 putative solute:sodium symporter small subunit [Noviherbaspirillum humi]